MSEPSNSPAGGALPASGHKTRRAARAEEQTAAAEFEPPWEHSKGEWEPPSNVEYVDSVYLLPAVRIAWLSLYSTRAELEVIHADLGDDCFEDMVNGIAEAREYFVSFARV